VLVINGDLAYDLESDNGIRGDNFLRNISKFAHKWPLMVIDDKLIIFRPLLETTILAITPNFN
jgi:hypothetical protein